MAGAIASHEVFVSKDLPGGMKSFETIPHLHSFPVREFEMAEALTSHEVLASEGVSELKGIEVMVVVRFPRPVTPDE
jgi:hypothetical protein